MLVVLVLLIAACGAEDDEDTASTDAEDSASIDDGLDTTADDEDGDAADVGDLQAEAAQALDEPELENVVTELASGIGSLTTAQDDAIAGVVDGGAVCDDVADPRAQPAASQVEVEIVTVVDGCLHFSYDVANFRSFLEDLDELSDAPDVIGVSPLLLEYRLNQLDTPWPLDAIDGTDLLSQPETPTGEGVVVAIVDSGINSDQPGLENADIRRVPDTGAGDYISSGHGTVAARIIVAPLAGADRAIAPDATLLDVPADLCDRTACGCDPCAEMTAAEAIRWSVDNGADIVSMSFGYRPAARPAWWQILLDADQSSRATETIDIALAYAEASDVAMTAAAGNCAGAASDRCENEDQFEIPAGHASVIGVAALEQDEDGTTTRAWYSTRQSYVELAAPGGVIILDDDGNPVSKIGTSFATPFVSASLAVMLSSDGPLEGQPDAPELARQLLVETAVDLAPDGRDESSGHGQIQLGPALSAATAFAETNPPGLVSDDE